MLEWFDRLDTELVCALLEQWPTLEELQKVRRRDCARSSASSAVTIPNWSSAAWSESGRRCQRFG